jgi:putative PEP-CTERM system TPR-repeat lipoprotein
MAPMIRQAVLSLCLAGFAWAGSAGAAKAMADRNASQTYLADAKERIAQGRIDDAIVQLKNAVQADPNNIAARLQLADLYILTRNGISAEKEITVAIDRGKLKGTAQDKLAAAYLLEGKYEDVIDRLPPDSASPESLPGLLSARGEAYYTLGDLSSATDAYQEAQRLTPSDPRPKIGLARVLIRKGDLNGARSLVDVAIRADPNSYDAKIADGQVEQAAGDLKGAVAAFDDALASKPDDVIGHMARAVALIDLRQYDLALKDVLAIRRTDPAHPTAAYLNALIQARKANYQGARDILLQSDALLRNYPPAVFLSGAVAYAQGAYEQASSDLKRYLADEPNSIPAARLLGAALLRTGDPDGAAAILEPVVAKVPNDDRVRAILGSAYMARKQYDAAIEQLKLAVAAAPDKGPLRTKLLVGYLAVGDDNGAYDALGPALAKDPESVQVATLLARNELRAKHYDRVLAVGRELTETYPKNPVGETIVAASYWGKGDIRSARAHYARALGVDPAYEGALLSLSRLDVQQRNYGAARDRYQSLLAKNPNHVAALMGLYWMAFAQDDEAAQARWLTRAIETNPGAMEPQLELVRRHAAAGDYDRALLEANALARNYPQNAKVLQILTEIQLQVRDPIAAITTASQLVNIAPSLPRGYLLKARSQIAVSNMEDARTTLRHGLDIMPHDAPLTSELVRLEMRAARFDDALALAEDFRTLAAGSTGDELIGDVYLAMNRLDDAIAAYKAGYAKAADAALAVRLNTAYVRRSDPDAGIAALKTWVAANPGDYDTRRILAAAQLDRGQLSNAAKNFETLYAANKTDPIVLNNLAWIYNEQHDPRALEMARKAYAANNNSAQILDTLGWVSLSSDNQIEGLDYLRMAAAMSPRSPQIRYHLAVALTKTGHPDEAKSILTDLLADTSGFAEMADARQLWTQLKH